MRSGEAASRGERVAPQMTVDRNRIHDKRDRLRQLRAFCHVAQRESITEAARHLGISQPAVSRHVRELTHELEAVLFERSGPRITLTPAGERFHRLARPLVEAMDRLPCDFLREIDDLISGEMRVAVGPNVVDFVLPPFLKRFRDEYPGIHVHCQTVLTHEGLDLLSANEVDFVFGVEQARSEAFLYRPVCSYDLVFITPEDHPLAEKESLDFWEAENWPAVVPPTGSYNRQVGEALARSFGTTINAAVEADGWVVIKELVADGLGISLLPSVCVDPRDRLRVLPTKPSLPSGSYGVFTRQGQPLSPPAERFIRLTTASDPDASADSHAPSAG